MKLRIRQYEYVNQGTLNPALKGKKEFHVTTKWDSKEEADEFVIFLKRIPSLYFDKPITSSDVKTEEAVREIYQSFKKPVKKRKYVKKTVQKTEAKAKN